MSTMPSSQHPSRFSRRRIISNKPPSSTVSKLPPPSQSKTRLKTQPESISDGAITKFRKTKAARAIRSLFGLFHKPSKKKQHKKPKKEGDKTEDESSSNALSQHCEETSQESHSQKEQSLTNTVPKIVTKSVPQIELTASPVKTESARPTDATKVESPRLIYPDTPIIASGPRPRRLYTDPECFVDVETVTSPEYVEIGGENRYPGPVMTASERLKMLLLGSPGNKTPVGSTSIVSVSDSTPYENIPRSIDRLRRQILKLNTHDVISPDTLNEVFLDDLYIEDDYLEDYSNSNCEEDDERDPSPFARLFTPAFTGDKSRWRSHDGYIHFDSPSIFQDEELKGTPRRSSIKRHSSMPCLLSFQSQEEEPIIEDYVYYSKDDENEEKPKDLDHLLSSSSTSYLTLGTDTDPNHYNDDEDDDVDSDQKIIDEMVKLGTKAETPRKITAVSKKLLKKDTAIVKNPTFINLEKLEDCAAITKPKRDEISPGFSPDSLETSRKENNFFEEHQSILIPVTPDKTIDAKLQLKDTTPGKSFKIRIGESDSEDSAIFQQHNSSYTSPSSRKSKLGKNLYKDKAPENVIIWPKEDYSDSSDQLKRSKRVSEGLSAVAAWVMQVASTRQIDNHQNTDDNVNDAITSISITSEDKQSQQQYPSNLQDDFSYKTIDHRIVMTDKLYSRERSGIISITNSNSEHNTELSSPSKPLQQSGSSRASLAVPTDKDSVFHSSVGYTKSSYPHRPRFESGYSSKSRCSTPATPLSDPPPTPMGKLQSGLIMSPQSLNKLDGITPRSAVTSSKSQGQVSTGSQSSQGSKTSSKFLFPPVQSSPGLQAVLELSENKSESFVCSEKTEAKSTGSKESSSGSKSQACSALPTNRQSNDNNESNSKPSDSLSDSKSAAVLSLSDADIDSDVILSGGGDVESLLTSLSTAGSPYSYASGSPLMSDGSDSTQLSQQKENGVSSNYEFEENNVVQNRPPLPRPLPVINTPTIVELPEANSPALKRLKPISSSSPFHANLDPDGSQNIRKADLDNSPIGKQYPIRNQKVLNDLSSPRIKRPPTEQPLNNLSPQVTLKSIYNTAASQMLELQKERKKNIMIVSIERREDPEGVESKERNDVIKEGDTKSGLGLAQPLAMRRKSSASRSIRTARTCLRFGANENGVDSPEESSERKRTSEEYLILRKCTKFILSLLPSKMRSKPFIDIPGIMDNLKSNYKRIMNENVSYKDITNLPHLKKVIKLSGKSDDPITVENSIDELLLNILAKKKDRTISIADFIFQNLLTVLSRNSSFFHLPPELVAFLLNNDHSFVLGHNGFPLSYKSSEKQVLQASMKYVQKINLDNPIASRRAQRLLYQTVDRDLFLKEESTSTPKSSQISLHKFDNQESTIDASGDSVEFPPPRISYDIIYNRSHPFSTTSENEHSYMADLSAESIQISPIPENAIGKHRRQVFLYQRPSTSSSTPKVDTSVDICSICDEETYLRSLSFTYSVTDGITYIVDIGLQYMSTSGKKNFHLAPPSAFQQSLENNNNIGSSSTSIRSRRTRDTYSISKPSTSTDNHSSTTDQHKQLRNSDDNQNINQTPSRNHRHQSNHSTQSSQQPPGGSTLDHHEQQLVSYRNNNNHKKSKRPVSQYYDNTPNAKLKRQIFHLRRRSLYDNSGQISSLIGLQPSATPSSGRQDLMSNLSVDAPINLSLKNANTLSARVQDNLVPLDLSMKSGRSNLGRLSVSSSAAGAISNAGAVAAAFGAATTAFCGGTTSTKVATTPSIGTTTAGNTNVGVTTAIGAAIATTGVSTTITAGATSHDGAIINTGAAPAAFGVATTAFRGGTTATKVAITSSIGTTTAGNNMVGVTNAVGTITTASVSTTITAGATSHDGAIMNTGVVPAAYGATTSAFRGGTTATKVPITTSIGTTTAGNTSVGVTNAVGAITTATAGATTNDEATVETTATCGATTTGTGGVTTERIDPDANQRKVGYLVLEPGEHVTGVSVQGISVLYNIEFTTNHRRRVRAHRLPGAPNVSWTKIQRPANNDNSPFCLHALVGNPRISANGNRRLSHVSAVWAVTSRTSSKRP